MVVIKWNKSIQELPASFLTYQVRVVKFYVSWPAASSSFSSSFAGLQLQALDRSVPCRTRTASLDQSHPRRTSTASSRARCSPPDPNSNLWIKVIPAGPQLRALDRECSPPDLHRKLRIRAFPAGPPPQAQDQSVPRLDLRRKLRIKVFPDGPQPRAPDQSVPRGTSTTKNLRRYTR